jgi:hypothetical protein
MRVGAGFSLRRYSSVSSAVMRVKTKLHKDRKFKNRFAHIEILFAAIYGLEEESVDLMKKLIAINSVGPSSDGPGEQEKADFLRNYLSQIGFKQGGFADEYRISRQTRCRYRCIKRNRV